MDHPPLATRLRRPPFRRLIAAVATLLVLGGPVVISAPASAAVIPTYLAFDSEPGDFIGGGVDRTWYPVDGRFEAHHGAGLVTVQFMGGPDWWSLNFKAPSGAALEAGPYEGATRYPFQSPTRPGLTVSGSGRGCNTSTGRFDVLEAAYRADGTVERFAADFEQHCEGQAAALRGSIRYSASATLPPAPDGDGDGVPNRRQLPGRGQRQSGRRRP